MSAVPNGCLLPYPCSRFKTTKDGLSDANSGDVYFNVINDLDVPVKFAPVSGRDEWQYQAGAHRGADTTWEQVVFIGPGKGIQLFGMDRQQWTAEGFAGLSGACASATWAVDVTLGKVQDILLSKLQQMARVDIAACTDADGPNKMKKGKQNKTRTGRFAKLRAKAEAKAKREDERKNKDRETEAA